MLRTISRIHLDIEQQGAQRFVLGRRRNPSFCGQVREEFLDLFGVPFRSDGVCHGNERNVEFNPHIVRLLNNYV